MSDELEIRVATPDDAGSLVACFERCYGATYAWDAFDDATRAVGDGLKSARDTAEEGYEWLKSKWEDE